MPHEALLDPLAHDARSRLAGLLFWIVLPILAVVAVVVASVDFSHRINAQPLGTTGTYVAQIRSCQGNVCQIAGTFTSDDNHLVVRNVLGDYRWKVGEKHPVVLNTQSEIISPAARWNPVATVVGGAAAVIYLSVWAWFAGSAIRRRRGNQSPGSPAAR